MISTSQAARHWVEFAGNERALLGRHLNGSALETTKSPAAAEEDSLSSLAPIVPISLLTLFMLWVVISPL